MALQLLHRRADKSIVVMPSIVGIPQPTVEQSTPEAFVFFVIVVARGFRDEFGSFQKPILIHAELYDGGCKSITTRSKASNTITDLFQTAKHVRFTLLISFSKLLCPLTCGYVPVNMLHRD